MGNLSLSLLNAFRRTPLFSWYRSSPVFGLYQESLYRRWLKSGGRLPPPHIAKRKIVRDYAARFDLHVFVETGTYLGEMVQAVSDLFEKIYSIELDERLYRNAQKRFSAAKHIVILHGDSGQVIPQVLREISQPCLFWLDGHYSGGITARGALATPVLQELASIFAHPLAKRHVILIDDAGCFTEEDEYPSLSSLKDFASQAGMETFEVKDDIIRIHDRGMGIASS